MMWVIRGTDARSGEDFAWVVEADTQTSAEIWAMKRGVPAEVIAPAEDSDIAAARRVNRLWQTSPRAKYLCFGRPIALRQVMCLMLAGVLTAGLVVVRTARPGRPGTVAKAHK
jgi:hypothetical protein